MVDEKTTINRRCIDLIHQSFRFFHPKKKEAKKNKKMKKKYGEMSSRSAAITEPFRWQTSRKLDPSISFAYRIVAPPHWDGAVVGRSPQSFLKRNLCFLPLRLHWLVIARDGDDQFRDSAREIESRPGVHQKSKEKKMVVKKKKSFVH